MVIVIFILLFLPAIAIGEDLEISSQMEGATSDLKRLREGLKQDMAKWKELWKMDSAQTASNPEFLLHKIRMAFYDQTAEYSSLPVIKPWQLKEILTDTNLILIDVRQPEEQAVSTIPGALTPMQFSQKFRRKKGLDQMRILTFDTIGYRSAIFAFQLTKKGLAASILEGGLLAWTHEGGALVQTVPDSAGVSTHKVHIFSKDLNWVHPDYTAVW